MLFGYNVESGFDLALEQRRDRMWWPLLGGTAVTHSIFDYRTTV